MSRSGYVDDYDYDNLIYLWRGTVTRALNGKRGQSFLRDLVAAMDALPAPRLIESALQAANGEVCAIGSVGLARGVGMGSLDPYDAYAVSAKFNIAQAMAREIAWINDEAGHLIETPEQRWARVHAWAVRNIKRGVT